MSNARNLANLLGTKTKVKDVDVDGTELILDSDGDTSITADTDDQVDFKIGGTDRVSIAGANIKVLTGNIQLGASGSETGQIEINSTRLLLRSTGDASGLRFDGSAYTPFKNGSQADGTVDLGSSSGKYKDLYLGGGLYVGGTGSANYLEDYEEGTWTPAVTVGGVSTANGHYKKIGGMVFLRAYVTGFTNSSNNETMFITGVPFTIATQGAVGVAMWENINSDFKFDISYINGSSQVQFYYSNGGSYSEMRHTYLDGSNAGVHFTATYLTDQ